MFTLTSMFIRGFPRYVVIFDALMIFKSEIIRNCLKALSLQPGLVDCGLHSGGWAGHSVGESPV